MGLSCHEADPLFLPHSHSLLFCLRLAYHRSPMTTSSFSAHIVTGLDRSHLPESPLYGTSDTDPARRQGLGWELSPAPFALSAGQADDLRRLGPVLHRLMETVDALYRQSARGSHPLAPEWVAALYDQGKPDSLRQFARMKRLRSHGPLVLRPDLLLQEQGWTLCEIDAVPGGLGFTSALNRFYRKNGFSVLEPSNGLPGLFLNILKACAPQVEDPVIAIVLSDEAADYRAEMQWLVDSLRQGDDLTAPYANIALVHPRELDLIRDRLVFTDPGDGREKPVDVIYRFFELFDLPNIPKIELIQYAVKKGLVHCTPPFKPHLEEKLSLALLHHPALAAWWEQSLGPADFDWLKQLTPPGWVLDPAPIPPQGLIPNLTPGGKPVRDFHALGALSQKERELVIKPSGFSPLGWGSRGVTIGHDHSAEAWRERLEAALSAFEHTPYILQQYRAASVFPVKRLDLDTGVVSGFQARIRLCPYYLVQDGRATLAAALATACPADKKLIHGMRDAVMMPVAFETQPPAFH